MSCLKQQTVQAIHSQMDVFMFRVNLKFADATRLLEGSKGFGELDFVNIVQLILCYAKEMFAGNNNIPVNSQYPGN